MSSIREIVSRIDSVAATQQITKAMKLVAAAKLSKVQQKLLHLRPYAEKLSAILAHVIAGTDQPLARRYTQERQLQKLLLVVMTSDKGLCGSFNKNVFKKVIAHTHQVADLYSAQIDLLVIGKKAWSFFKKQDYRLITDYTALSHNLSFEPASQAATSIIDTFLNHTYDRVELVYTHFISAVSQAVQVTQFLPIANTTPILQTNIIDYIYEPSKVVLVEELISRLLKIQFYRALIESVASEHGARLTTMSKATDSAEELLKSLRISYNRSRQAAITREISEIVAGAEALSNC
ncbi:MAG: ATP synthase F1 subunit gamma [Bacteroidota bacterium]